MRLLIRARNAEIGIEGGRVVAAANTFDRVITFDGEVRSGLINAHDHLHRNHYGRLGRPPYRDAYAWAADIQRNQAAAIAAGRRVARRDALLVGALKNLLAGVTHVVHHDRWLPEFDAGFPLKVVHVASADSIGMTPTLAVPPAPAPFALHLSEGIVPRSANEVRAVDAMGLLGPRLLAVHCVGVDRDGERRLRQAGAAIVWCPSSNLFLFHRTAPAFLLDGVDVLLGSDSLLTGDGDLLDEIRLAHRLRLLDDDRLAAAVGDIAAQRLGLPERSLAPGSAADLVLLRRPLLQASREDVALVLVDGAPRVACPEIAAALGLTDDSGGEVRIGAVRRWVAGPLLGACQHLEQQTETLCA
jgi:hypothetical protein